MFWDAHILAGGQARRLGRPGQGRARRGRSAHPRSPAGRARRPCGPHRHRWRPRAPHRRRARSYRIGCRASAHSAGSTPRCVSATSDRTLVLACDMPYVTGPFLEYPRHDRRRNATPRCRGTGTGLHPLCAVYARSAAPAIRRAIDQGVRRVREAIDPLRMHLIEGAGTRGVRSRGPAAGKYQHSGRLRARASRLTITCSCTGNRRHRTAAPGPSQRDHRLRRPSITHTSQAHRP